MGAPLEFLARKGLQDKLLSQMVLSIGRRDESCLPNPQVQRVKGVWRNWNSVHCWWQGKMAPWKSGSSSKGGTALLCLSSSTSGIHPEKGRLAPTQTPVPEYSQQHDSPELRKQPKCPSTSERIHETQPTRALMEPQKGVKP